MNGTLNFVLRTQKTLKNGKTPIYLTYSLHRVRLFHSLEQSIFSIYWNAETKRAVYIPLKEAKKQLKEVPENDLLTETEIKDINRVIEDIKSEIEKIEIRFIANNTVFSSQMVIDELKANDKALTKKEEPNSFLFDFMDQYIKDHEITRAKGSLSVYRSVKRQLDAYQKATNKKVTFESIDSKFFNNLNTFLIKRTKTDIKGNVTPALNNTTIAKILSTLKTFLGYARKQGIKVSDNYKDYSIKKQNLEVIALEQNELDALINYDLANNKRLDRVRDIFVFSASTGMRYSDTAMLKREHIKNNEIRFVVKKTKQKLFIPLNRVSAAILDKYKEDKKILPMVTNQELNRCLKDLCQLVGINTPIEIVRYYGAQRVETIFAKWELVHFHTARKTFASLSLEKGMSAEQVMLAGGWETYNSFKRYVKITDKALKNSVTEAWGEVNNLKIVG